jgi:hypothetical protein
MFIVTEISNQRLPEPETIINILPKFHTLIIIIPGIGSRDDILGVMKEAERFGVFISKGIKFIFILVFLIFLFNVASEKSGIAHTSLV